MTPRMRLLAPAAVVLLAAIAIDFARAQVARRELLRTVREAAVAAAGGYTAEVVVTLTQRCGDVETPAQHVLLEHDLNPARMGQLLNTGCVPTAATAEVRRLVPTAALSLGFPKRGGYRVTDVSVATPSGTRPTATVSVEARAGWLRWPIRVEATQPVPPPDPTRIAGTLRRAVEAAGASRATQ